MQHSIVTRRTSHVTHHSSRVTFSPQAHRVQSILWQRDVLAAGLNPKPQTPNPQTQAPNPRPQTPNPKPQTPNPKPSLLQTMRAGGAGCISGDDDDDDDDDDNDDVYDALSSHHSLLLSHGQHQRPRHRAPRCKVLRYVICLFRTPISNSKSQIPTSNPQTPTPWQLAHNVNC